MQYEGPADYQSADAATSLCFTGPIEGVCGVLGGLGDGALSDIFGMYPVDENDESGGCKIDEGGVAVHYGLSESDNFTDATIPPCK